MDLFSQSWGSSSSYRTKRCFGLGFDKDEIIKNDPKKPKVGPKGPIDESSVGGWKVYQESHYYKKGLKSLLLRLVF